MKITDKRNVDAGVSITITDIPCGTYFTGRCDSMGINEDDIHLRYYDGVLVVDDPAGNWDVESTKDQFIDNYQPLDVELIIHGPLSV